MREDAVEELVASARPVVGVARAVVARVVDAGEYDGLPEPVRELRVERAKSHARRTAAPTDSGTGAGGGEAATAAEPLAEAAVVAAAVAAAGVNQRLGQRWIVV